MFVFPFHAADSTIAQLRAKLATPSKAYRNMQQFPTFGPPKKPFHSVPSSSNTRGLRSPEPPSPVRGAVAGAPSFFVPTYPSTDYNDGMPDMSFFLSFFLSLSLELINAT